MKTILTLLILLLSTPLAFADRILKARSLSSNQWYQRIDSGSKEIGVFQAEVAGQFNVLGSDVFVVVIQGSPLVRRTAVAEQAAGLHEGRTVIPAPASIPTPDEVRRATKRNAINNAISVPQLKAAILLPD